MCFISKADKDFQAKNQEQRVFGIGDIFAMVGLCEFQTSVQNVHSGKRQSMSKMQNHRPWYWWSPKSKIQKVDQVAVIFRHEMNSQAALGTRED